MHENEMDGEARLVDRSI